jgi:GNAT superfamily N-acetyltransferase
VSEVIRPFVPPDRPPLEAAINAVCAEGRWMSTPCFRPTPAWTHALEAPTCSRHLLLVAENEGQIAGWCRLFPLSGCNGHANEVELGIGLLPEYRGHGLGRALVNHALDWAATAGMERVTLLTRADNLRAMHLFERCEFIVTNHGPDGWIEMVRQPLPPRG